MSNITFFSQPKFLVQAVEKRKGEGQLQVSTNVYSEHVTWNNPPLVKVKLCCIIVTCNELGWYL